MKGWQATGLAALLMVSGGADAADAFGALKRTSGPTELALGDSLLAMADTGSALNGGVGGYRLADVLAEVGALQSDGLWNRVSCLVVSVGVNDAHLKDGGSRQARLDAFRSTLAALIVAAKGKPLVLMTVAEPASGEIAKRIDRPLVTAINGVIRQSASAHVYDMAAALRSALGERYEDAFLDGVHLNRTGYLAWNAAFAEALDGC